MEQTIQQINSYEHKDRDGNLIGTRENRDRISENTYNKITKAIDTTNLESTEIIEIHNSINEYKAVRFCYDGDTSHFDNILNSFIKQFQGIAKHVQFEKIDKIK